MKKKLKRKNKYLINLNYFQLFLIFSIIFNYSYNFINISNIHLIFNYFQLFLIILIISLTFPIFTLFLIIFNIHSIYHIIIAIII